MCSVTQIAFISSFKSICYSTSSKSLCQNLYSSKQNTFLKSIHSEAELFVKTAFVIFMNPEFRSSWHYIYILYHVFHHVMIDWYVFHVLSEVFQPFNYKAYRQFWRFRGSTLQPILLRTLENGLCVSIGLFSLTQITISRHIRHGMKCCASPR